MASILALNGCPGSVDHYSAPVLIDELQQIKERAVDRRDIGPQIQAALDEWLQQHPLPEKAQEALIEALRRQSLIPSVPPSGPEQ